MRLAVPIIIGNVGQTLITLTDTIMVGRLGADSLGAAGFTGGLFFVFMIFGIGVLAPMSALFAQSHSRNEHDEGGDLLRHSVVAAVLISVITMAGLWVMMPLMGFMGQTAEVVKLSMGFAPYLILSLLPSLLYQAYKQFTDGIGRVKVGMYVMIVCVLLNILGNWLFINGHWGFPEMGLNGSGLATLLCRILMAVMMMAYVHRHPEFKKYFAQKWRRHIHNVKLKKIFHLGIPNGLTYIFEVGAFTMSSVMMGWLGSAPLAAHQISLNLASISFLVTVGIGAAGTIRVGYESGLRHFREARYAGRVALILGAGYMLFSAVFVFFLREPLARIYTEDMQVIGYAASFLAVAAAFQFFDGIQAVAVGILRGLQDTKWPSVLAFIAYWIIGLPIGYYLAFKLDLQGPGIWWGLFIGLVFTAIFLTIRFERLSARKQVPPSEL
ncbi:MATE family efflux transporter [Bdellovibrio sp. HCB337]|uniref:MATE family efflux transporter n=1 Tax=Bdellovibrio sp. HCB337 TaxID=3394358 RepID=UPI0039A4A4EC